MKLTPIIPHLQLVPFVRSFWLFESDFGNPLSSGRVIAPNAKIVLPFENELFAESRSLHQEHREGRIQLIGNAAEPSGAFHQRVQTLFGLYPRSIYHHR
jgi:hypothetical protein